jgi:uncharacterized repeat protein (TIGR01451 family)
VTLGPSNGSGDPATCAIEGEASVDALPADCCAADGVQTRQLSRATGTTNTTSNEFEGLGSATVSVLQAPDITVAKTPDDGEINAGENAVFTIVVTNNGPGPAEGVMLTDTLPADKTWSITSETADACSLGGDGGNELTCDIGELADGATYTVEVTAPTTADNCGEEPNTATVSATNEDPEGTAPNSDDALITVLCGGLEIIKTTDGQGPVAGVEFNVTGPGDFDETCTTPDCSFTDLEPGEYTISEGTPPAGTTFDSCSPASPVTVVAGETLTVTCNNITVEAQWCSPGYWRNHPDAADEAAAAGGFSMDDTYSSIFGSAPPLKPQGVRADAPTDPTLREVLDNPQWYGGDAFNIVADLLSELHPDVSFTGERVENCPLN